MLRVLRRQMKGILWATVIAVSVSFMFYGARRRGSAPSTPLFVGEIYGRKVSVNEYRKSLDWVSRMAMMRYGRRFSEIAKFLDLEKQAWEKIILLKHAELKGIRVSDDELVSVISSLPTFQKEGKFDREIYRTVLRHHLGVGPEYFEDGMRREISTSKLRDSITDCVKLTEQELRQYYRFVSEEVRVKYILFKSSDFEKEVGITEMQIKDYFESHREEFMEPEKVKLQYILFSVEDVEDAEIEDYYSRNEEKYKDPDKKKAKPLKEVKEEIRRYLKNEKALKVEEEVREILSLLEEEEKSWDELEVQETGFVEKGSSANIPPQCIFAAFSLEIGDSELVRGGEGVYIVKLVDRKESSLAENLDNVAEKVEKKLKEIESSKLARSKAERCLDGLKEEKDIAAIAKKYSIEVTDADFFTRRGYVKGLGAVPEFARVAFGLKGDSPFDMVEIRSGFCVLEFGERKSIDEEKFAEENDKIAKMVLNEKKERIFKDWFWLLKERAGLRITYTFPQ